MKKEFKKKIGDEVWVMHNNFPIKGIIGKLWYIKFIGYTDFEKVNESELYTVFYMDRILANYTIDELYDSKEDLLKSL